MSNSTKDYFQNEAPRRVFDDMPDRYPSPGFNQEYQDIPIFMPEIKRVDANMNVMYDLGIHYDLDVNQSLSINNLSHLSSNRTNRLQSHLCGFPAFCSNAAQTSCVNTTLATCDECSYAGFVAFGVAVALLGLTIVALNSLVLWQNVRKKNKGIYEKTKASLAVADIVRGLQPFMISLYNLHWTIHSTANELDQTQLALRGSPQAIAGGIFHLFGITSSLYHLVFLSQQRVFALRWPLKYRVQKLRILYIGLGIVWILALLTSVAPAWFPGVYIFTYSQTIFLFIYTLTKIGSTDFAHLAVIVIITCILPFFLMTCFTIYSTVLIRRNTEKSKKLTGNVSNQEAQNKREAAMLKTVALMQAGFTITLMPVVNVVMLTYGKVLTCGTISTPYMICFYLSMSNSLVNSIVYSIRDKKFRKSILQCFTLKKCSTSVSDSTIHRERM